MIRKYSSVVVFSGAMFSMIFSGQALAVRTIYGIGNAEHFNSASHGGFYIQAESFLSKARAKQYQRSLQSKTTYPVRTLHGSRYYRVVIGPINSSQEVRRVDARVSSPTKT